MQETHHALESSRWAALHFGTPDYTHIFIFYNQSVMMIWYGCQPLRIHGRAGVPKGFTGFQDLDLLWGTWLSTGRNS